jgi:hypothetical protein
MTTLLSICDAVCDEIQETRPGAIVGNPAPTARRLLRYANKTGDRVMREYAWQALRRTSAFTALAQIEQSGAIPADFDRFIAETFWDRTNKVLVPGPVGAVEFQSLSSLTVTGASRKFAYRGNAVHVLPAPDGGESYAFDYVSNLWCSNGAGAGQTAFLADTDVPYLDAELMVCGIMAEWLSSEGMPVAAAAGQYDSRYRTLIGNDAPGGDVMTVADIFGGERRSGAAPLVSGNIYYG